MKLATIFLLFLILNSIFFSCIENDRSTYLLKQAQDIVNENPDQALILLDSIENKEIMSRDNYMHYLVTYVGAKMKANKDIRQDSLIFEAQKYFNERENKKESAIANLHAAYVYSANDMLSKALESFMLAAHDAQQIHDDLTAGRSLNNIGYTYLEQGILDSAVINCKKALFFFDKIKDSDKYKLGTLNNIGRIYSDLREVDSSYFYFEKSLKLAIQTKNEYYQSVSLQNLGIVYYRTKDYDKAIEYFRSTFVLPTTDLEQIHQINLYLLKIYINKNESDSTTYYANLIEKNLPEINCIHTIRRTYTTLAYYYELKNDYKKALDYRNAEKKQINQINQKNRPLELLTADKNFYLQQKSKRSYQFLSYSDLFLLIGGIICISLLIFAISLLRIYKKDQEEIKLQKEKYGRIKDQLMDIATEYKDIESEISAILNEGD